LSAVVSPFEDNEVTQEELIETQYLEYRKDAIVDAIGKKTGNQEFDLYFEDVLSELDSSETIHFLVDCLRKLKTIYPVDVVYSYIETDNTLDNNPDSIIAFLKFFVYNSWMDQIVGHLPVIDVKDLRDRKFILRKVKDTYYKTIEKIIKDVSIHPLVRYHFKYCPEVDGISTLMIFIFKDIPGVISKQLVKSEIEEIRK